MHAALIPEARASDDPTGACVSDLGEHLTNSAFAARVRAASARLACHGVGPGDVVAAMLPNRIEFVVLLFATWRLGATLSPVNPVLTAQESGYQLADCEAVLVVADAERAAKVRDGLTVLAPEELSGLDPGLALAPAPADLDELALLIYTSGTTGRPKGVMLGHDNIAAMAAIWIDWLAMTTDDRCLLILPLFHVNGIMVSVVGPLAAGGSVVIGPRFDADDVWDVVEAVRPTYFSAVPTIVTALAALPADRRPDTSSLRFVGCGAAPASAQLLRSFESRYGVPVIEGYGLSECTVAATINPLGAGRRAGTVGLPLPGLEVAVLDLDGAPLPAGEPGEVVIAGATVMHGYLHLPEETASTLRDGWLHTGDVGYFDEHRHLVISDRIKDLIIWGGENISAQEIERVVLAHPAVLDASVVGRPHERYGEEPVAFVALRDGAHVDEAQLLAHCATQLARFKVPRAVWVLDALPMNAVGKLVKAPLRELARASAAGP